LLILCLLLKFFHINIEYLKGVIESGHIKAGIASAIRKNPVPKVSSLLSLKALYILKIPNSEPIQVASIILTDWKTSMSLDGIRLESWSRRT
jgi:hypothetical protein